jgi:RimJ/RimL family protein N-acetyltransferase
MTDAPPPPPPPLRAPRLGDHAVLRALRLDVALQHLLLASPPEGGDGDVAGWLGRRAAAGFLWTVADAADGCAGFAQIADIHRRSRHGRLGLCLAPEARGRGLGRAALRALCVQAAGPLGLRKLLCEVRADNAPALTLYAAEGFRTVGVLEAHYDDGRRCHDVALLERLFGRPAWGVA